MENALKNYTPSNRLASVFAFISKSAQQNKINDDVAMNIIALRNACKAPNASLSICADVTIDYLSQLNLNAQPINPIIKNLLHELSILLGPNKKPPSAELRDQICDELRNYAEGPKLKNESNSSG